MQIAVIEVVFADPASRKVSKCPEFPIRQDMTHRSPDRSMSHFVTFRPVFSLSKTRKIFSNKQLSKTGPCHTMTAAPPRLAATWANVYCVTKCPGSRPAAVTQVDETRGRRRLISNYCFNRTRPVFCVRFIHLRPVPFSASSCDPVSFADPVSFTCPITHGQILIVDIRRHLQYVWTHEVYYNTSSKFRL